MIPSVQPDFQKNPEKSRTPAHAHSPPSFQELTTRIRQIDQRIEQIKATVSSLGPMRPGTLSQQYQDPKGRARPYWQLSYTHRGKSRTDYIRAPWLRDIRQALDTYHRFRELTRKWTDLAVERGRLQLRLRRLPATEQKPPKTCSED